jgi:inosose dehydratase
MRLAYATITWGGVVGHPAGVTSVKDLFYLAHGSTQTAVAEIGEAGYAGIEMFDGGLKEWEHRPDAFRELLAGAGVELAGVYSGANFIYPDILDDELWRIDQAAALGEQFGATVLTVGGGAKRAAGTTDGDYELLAAGLDRVVEIAEAHGLRAAYHPHLTTIVEHADQVDRILGLSRIGFCPDTGHLAAGGADPVELIRRHAARVVHVHLKDFRPDPFTFLPLGRGIVDITGVLGVLKAAGYDGWMTVELDEYPGAPPEAARESLAWLRRSSAGEVGVGTPDADGDVPVVGRPLVVAAIFRAAEGRFDDLEAELAALVAPTRAEAGCQRYELNRATNEPGVLYFTEIWASPAAHEAHLRTPHIRHLADVLADLVAEPIRELKGHELHEW